MAAKKSRKFSSLVIYSHLQRLKGMQTTKLRPLSKSQNWPVGPWLGKSS